MNIQSLRDTALALPNVTERMPFGPDTLAFEIGGKMFCLIDLSGEWDFYNLKVNPELSQYLRERFPMQVAPAYHMNKKHWVSVKFDRYDTGDGLPLEAERLLIAHSRRQTLAGLPAAKRRELCGGYTDLEIPDTAPATQQLMEIIVEHTPYIN